MFSFLRVNCSVVGRTPMTGMWKTQMTFEPMELIQSATRLLSPLITDEMVMTVVTPMTMPRMVNPERSLLALSVLRAILTDSRVCPWAMVYLVFSCQLSVFSCQLSVVSCQLV